MTLMTQMTMFTLPFFFSLFSYGILLLDCGAEEKGYPVLRHLRHFVAKIVRDRILSVLFCDAEKSSCVILRHSASFCVILRH